MAAMNCFCMRAGLFLKEKRKRIRNKQDEQEEETTNETQFCRRTSLLLKEKRAKNKQQQKRGNTRGGKANETQ